MQFNSNPRFPPKNLTIIVPFFLFGICSITAAEIGPTPENILQISEILDTYLASEPNQKEQQSESLNPIFHDCELLKLADSAGNFAKVLDTRQEKWSDMFIFQGPPEWVMEEVFATRKSQLGSQQLSSSRLNMFAFAETGIEFAFEGVMITNQLWDWFAYKTFRRHNTTFELQVISTQLSGIIGDFAAIFLIRNKLHIWRRGSGVFLIFGSRDGGKTQLLYPVRNLHGQSYEGPLEKLTYSTFDVQNSDVIFYASSSAQGEFSPSELLGVCGEAGTESIGLLHQKVEKLYNQKVPLSCAGHRLHAFKII